MDFKLPQESAPLSQLRYAVRVLEGKSKRTFRLAYSRLAYKLYYYIGPGKDINLFSIYKFKFSVARTVLLIKKSGKLTLNGYFGDIVYSLQ